MSSDASPVRPARKARVTITDVARSAGVSVATVSKVINDRDGVALGTAERVKAVVSELGYESSLVASSLRRGRSGVLGVLLAEFEPFSTELLKGISARLSGSDYDLMAYTGALGPHPQDQAGWERRSLSSLAGTLIDGAIIVTPTVELPDTTIPVVAVDPHAGPSGPAAIDSDNLGGARAATEYLLSLGHRRIAHLRGRADLQSALLREQGYREALTAAGIPERPELIADGGYRSSPAAESARKLLTLPQPPTAIFAANDLSAIATIDVAQSLGLRVPEDLSVVGFDNVPEAVGTAPPLTTVAQPLREIGQEAVRMLLDLLAGHSLAQPHLHLPAQLVVRGTTARPADIVARA
ncbi:LacI family DNA-binding transcriptional regulator [Bogoriella caseilytica]|uniref:LacI family transcriptional regulator n=1 Tax=Bogoriella caseilytica TaxID=56055 RepID=A0A3N2BGA8_9MICO|nr:LacI family DNA-binding transcriptional regulator [Bogoriella caseilytica]ROR74303.1 LacI family transcriptional regulator [Bogoriella caseilytica]